MKLHHNCRAAVKPPYPFGHVFSLDGARTARRHIAACPHYAPTPLIDLKGAARLIGVERVFYKDEAGRFGLGSFKALGGAYAVATLLAEKVSERVGRSVDLAELIGGAFRMHTRGVTIVCASDGNHGRAVAAGAQVFGATCKIFLHEGVSAGRAAAIEALGADVVRTRGDYDQSVRQAAADAAAHGWIVVSDTSDVIDDPMPVRVMQGYGVLVLEVLEQLQAAREEPPTHVFLQAGVGGLAGAVVAHLWEALGPDRAPFFIIVEPERADCLFQSAKAGRPTPAAGDLATLMAGLSCGEVSRVAWPIIEAGAEFLITIPDHGAVEAMRLLANGSLGSRIVAGESGAAGLAGLLACSRNKAAFDVLRMDRAARVLLIGTEGATDRDVYKDLVGCDPSAVQNGL